MEKICGLLGKTRQGYYQRESCDGKDQVKSSILKELVEEIRKVHPRIGGRKLLHMIEPKLINELAIGRDAFFDFLREEGLLIRKTRRRVITTNSKHWMRRYPNLIRAFTPSAPNQLWVSDITYIDTTKEGFVYLFLITDAYSRKIVGWHMSANMEAKNAVIALKMALRSLPIGDHNLMHHSDRGAQYCSRKYVALLNKSKIQISMTENGDPLENAIAERVNGILKSEYLYLKSMSNLLSARLEGAKTILAYNQKRPHSSINMLTPEQAHGQRSDLKRRWINYNRIKYEKYKVIEESKVLKDLGIKQKKGKP